MFTDKPEIESLPVKVIEVVEPISAKSDELMVNKFADMVSQTGSGVADHMIFVTIPAGLLTMVGSARFRDVRI